MQPVRALWLVILLVLGACSMRSAINSLSSPEDRAFAQDFVQKMRSGDSKSLQSAFDPGVWQQSAPQFAQARSFYPPTPGTTELIGYHIATNTTNGATTQTKDYTLVTHDDSHWTTTVIRTQSNGGAPHRIVGWNVTGSREMPDLYRQYQAMESAIPWFRAGGLVVVLAAGALIFWLVRRSRRRRQASGTP